MRIGVGRKKIRMGDLLVAAGAITDEELQQALALQKEKGQKLGQTLLEEGFISRELLIATLTQQLGVEYIELKGCKFDDDVLKLIPEDIVMKYKVIPLGYDENNPNVLRVAMADPMDIIAVDDLGIITGAQIETLFAMEDDVTETIGKYYGNHQAMEAAEAYRKEREQDMLSQAEEDEYNADIENSPIVLLVKQILEGGVRQRASDIHIEPLETSVRVRYRIDGVLKQVMSYDYSLLSGISARLKIMGGMDISEKRKPQDGRISIMVDRKEFDIRLGMLPTVYGEKTVMRLTSKDGLTRPKSGLGFSAEEERVFDGILSNPHGIILVTGPTGSGKSTTLYTALSELNTEGVNIITVEDPVEANIDGINQCQINEKDPDINMIGEIRDGETADIAVKAAITGHLVVSTLHTNSAASTVTRLIDMGIEPYTAGDALVGVIAQRLVRRLCTCKQPRYAEEHEKRLLNVPDPNEDVVVYEPNGCPLCNETGFSGRIGVYEMMTVTRSLQQVIATNAPANEIEKQALQEGMMTLKLSCSQHVLNGITSISEMRKIVYEAGDEY